MQNIPLGIYKHIKSTYIPLVESFGTCCDNCGRLISNIVTVQHEGGKYFTIGQDCAKTLFSKQENESIDKAIKHETKIYKKIAELKKYNKPFVLNERGQPCHPPETRSGYFIPY